jgi:hypothetical protein
LSLYSRAHVQKTSALFIFVIKSSYMNWVNIIVSLLLFLILIFTLFPLEDKVNKILELKTPKHFLITLALLLVLVVLAAVLKTSFIINLILLAFAVWAFVFGFMIDRKYIYSLALIFLASVPFLLILKEEGIAEFCAILTYLLLVLGVLKDIFYEKIFTE